MPVGGVAGQPGALQAEHDPGPAEGHLGDQLLAAAGYWPGRDPAVVQYAQAQPPAARLPAEHLPAQLLIPGDVTGLAGALTAAPRGLRRFSGRRPGPAPVPPSAGAR